MQNLWFSILPPIFTIAMAMWSKKIIPSLLIGLLAGSYFLKPTFTGGFETAVDYIVKTLTDSGSVQVLLFLYLFSGLMSLIKKSGGIKAFSDVAERHVKSERGVLFLLWALIPFTFIDCGFRIVGAGSITRSLVEKNKMAKERFAFMLNNTASPVVELIPIATTYVGFNIANISIGLEAAGNVEKNAAYTIWLKAIPLEFFSIVIIIITFFSIFYQLKKPANAPAKQSAGNQKKGMEIKMETTEPSIKPRVINLIVPLVSVISLSILFFWLFGKDKPGNSTYMAALTNTDPNRAMLVALLITIAISVILYFFQKYDLKEMTSDIISGGNEIMTTLVILTLAWPLASVSQALGLNDFIHQNLGTSMPAWSVAASLFVLSSTVTYFIGSGWGAASLIMPIAISLAVVSGASIPLSVAAIITGGTFGDVTSPVAGMTNMSSNIAHADHAKYLQYASSYNFIAAGVAAMLFVIVGIMN